MPALRIDCLAERRSAKCLKHPSSATPAGSEYSSRDGWWRMIIALQQYVSFVNRLLDLDPGLANDTTPALLLGPDVSVERLGRE